MTNIIYKVLSPGLNIRSGPGTDYEIWNELSQGEEFDSPSTSGWVPILMEDAIGWVKGLYVKKVNEQEPDIIKGAPWMEIALAERGVSEVIGDKDNSRIIEYLRVSNPEGAHDQPLHDEIYWCAAFMGWVFDKWGYHGTGTWWARDYMKWGKAVYTPYPGCVAVFSRGSGGHVGFYLGEGPNLISVYGGNTGNQVNQAWIERSRLLGYREPKL